MKAEKEHIDELIVSYLSNELDGNAVHELKEWIAASVENEKYFMQRQEIWFSAISVKEDVKYDKSKAFEQFKNRIANQRLNDKRITSLNYSFDFKITSDLDQNVHE